LYSIVLFDAPPPLSATPAWPLSPIQLPLI
jgi:hypothetical protein